MPDTSVYPSAPAKRDRFVLERRGPRPAHDPWRHQGVVVEDEPSPHGGRERVATVFLTGRECPWRCAMCDLWRYTTVTDTPAGAIPAQITRARAEIAAERPPVAAMKLYNAGSFFDPRAVPETDYAAVAAALAGMRRVIVESHPALAGARVDRLLDELRRAAPEAPAALDVAMGLETAHPEALARLNKRFTLDDFARAADGLAARGVALRVFLLIAPPFVPQDARDEWMLRSVDVALDCGAAIVSLIPTRAGNGTIDALASAGEYRTPTLDEIECSFRASLAHARGRGIVLLDLWDLDRFAGDRASLAARRAALAAMNDAQALPA
jgi:radical SAM enzyme (TIGR01210 family)